MKAFLPALTLASLSLSEVHAQDAKPELTQTVTTVDLPTAPLAKSITR